MCLPGLPVPFWYRLQRIQRGEDLESLPFLCLSSSSLQRQSQCIGFLMITTGLCVNVEQNSTFSILLEVNIFQDMLQRVGNQLFLCSDSYHHGTFPLLLFSSKRKSSKPVQETEPPVISTPWPSTPQKLIYQVCSQFSQLLEKANILYQACLYFNQLLYCIFITSQRLGKVNARRLPGSQSQQTLLIKEVWNQASYCLNCHQSSSNYYKCLLYVNHYVESLPKFKPMRGSHLSLGFL